MADKEAPSIRAIKTVPAEPGASDLKRTSFLRESGKMQLENVVYLVKIYISHIPVSAMGLMMYVGDNRVNRYWAFNGGLYFIVYDPSYFTKHKDDFVGVSTDGGATVNHSGFKLPSPPSAADAYAFRLLAANAEAHATLPSKDAALSE